MKTKTLFLLTLILSINFLFAQGPNSLNSTNAPFDTVFESKEKLKNDHSIFDPMYWEFTGGSRFATNKQKTIFQFALKNLNYASVTKIRGIDFQQTLVTDKRITVSYNPENENGKRLVLTIDGKKYTPFIADWQLKPVTEFADDSQNTSILTAYGRGLGDDTDFIYHEAFKNTLLGARLFQADITPFYKNYNYNTLPSYNGEVVLGYGENLPETTNKEALNNLDDFVYYNRPYGSWTITDYDISITLNESLSNENIFSNVKPYYHYWKKSEKYVWSEEIKKQLDTAHNAYKVAIKKYFTDNQIEYPEKYEEDGKTFFSNNFFGHSIKRVRDIEDEYERAYNEILDSAEKIEVAVPNEHLNQEMKDTYYGLLEQVNSPVYNALQNTMNYAALFRYVKKTDPQGWNTFLTAIKTINIAPDVLTPNEISLGW